MRHTRRQSIVRGGKLVAAGAVATASGPTIFVRDAKAAGQLKILQWSHFVPAHDRFDQFIGLASAFEEHVIDLSDVAATLEKK